MMIIVEAWRRVDSRRWQSSKVFFFSKNISWIFAMLVYQTVYIGVVCENLEDIQGNTVGKCMEIRIGLPYHRGSSEAARILRQRQIVQLWEFPWESPTHLPTNSAPVPRFFCFVCINPLVHHLKQNSLQKHGWRLASWTDPVFFAKAGKHLQTISPNIGSRITVLTQKHFV